MLVSDEMDYYYEMVLLSLYSLRLYHPKDIVEMVMDETTYQRLVRKKAPVLDDVTPIVVSIPSDYTKMQRSRYLKTRLRQIVKGDFLFLDCDTLVCDHLDDIDKTEADIAMVANEHDGRLISVNYDRCRQAGFNQIENEIYFNSGVIYSKDNKEARDLFEKWHSLWIESVKKGIFQDQPALCQANFDSSHIIKRLELIWNCQLFFFSGIDMSDNVKVFHYFTDKDTILRGLLFKHIKETGTISDSVANVARYPLTSGYAVFSMNDSRAVNYIYSDLLDVYDRTPKLFNFLISFSRIFVKPVVGLSKMKHRFHK